MYVMKTGLFSPQYRGETQEHAVSEKAVTTPAQLGEGRKDLGFRVT